MRDRVISTLGIWASLAVSIYVLLQRLTYTYYEIVPDALGDGLTLSRPTTVQSPVFWQFMIFVLILFLICAAVGGTYFVWRHAWSGEQAAPSAQDAKPKRTQRRRLRKRYPSISLADVPIADYRLNEADEPAALETLIGQRGTQRRR